MTPINTADDRDPRVPLLSLVFGYGPMLPVVAAAIVAWTASRAWPYVATSLAVWWAGALVIFLAGVRRGLAFRTAGGENIAQMATMLWLFVIGAAAFVVRTPQAALGLCLLGFVSIAVLDPIAARRGEAPAHFARLRPPQMAVGALALAALIAWHMRAGGVIAA
ncbi:DUF3429 domain-containing protein [Sphingomonas sp.]|uniref:DUF3429 domain-containing protein n=1 Tax=Sphingomonas sp. TaxID=28214 RepID=UPI003B004778